MNYSSMSARLQGIADVAYEEYPSSDGAAQVAITHAYDGECVTGPYGVYRMTRRGRVRYSDAGGTVTVPYLSRMARANRTGRFR